MITATDFGMNCREITTSLVWLCRTPQNALSESGGRKHLEYIKERRPVLYTNLVLCCKLHSYLADIDTPTQTRLALLIKQITEKADISEQLKAEEQMEWSRTMNSIHNRTEKAVNKEIIFA